MKRPLWIALLSSPAALALVSLSPFSPADDPLLLLGKPLQDALDHFGPPNSGTGTKALVSWTWSDEEGGSVRMAVHEERIVCVDTSKSKGPIRPNPTPKTGFYPSQKVEELLHRLGNPTRANDVYPARTQQVGRADVMAPGNAASLYADVLLWYADECVLVAGGRVLGPKPEPNAAHGPR